MPTIKLVKYDRAYYQKHRVEIAQRNREHYANDKPKYAERDRRRYEKAKLKIAEQKRRYRQEHRAELAERDHQYRALHKAQIAERERQYKQGHPDLLRARRLAAEGSWSLHEWQGLLRHYHHCPSCGRRWSALVKPTVDHILPLSRGGSNHITNLQPLCNLCNSRKGVKTIRFTGPKSAAQMGFVL